MDLWSRSVGLVEYSTEVRISSKLLDSCRTCPLLKMGTGGTLYNKLQNFGRSNAGRQQHRCLRVAGMMWHLAGHGRQGRVPEQEPMGGLALNCRL